jgi:hypothetical protein
LTWIGFGDAGVTGAEESMVMEWLEVGLLADLESLSCNIILAVPLLAVVGVMALRSSGAGMPTTLTKVGGGKGFI